jgi:hypothetical protein
MKPVRPCLILLAVSSVLGVASAAFQTIRDHSVRIARLEVSRQQSPVHPFAGRIVWERPIAARLVVTNLVHVPCRCGFCRPEEGVAVPEHLNRIGYDLAYEVSTNYLPVVIWEDAQ